MADSSSISSSNASKRPLTFGVPWAAIGAVVLVIAFELVLRGIGRMNLIAFASDEGQYHAVRDTIDAQGPAEVALVGSSQMREGISMPTLLPELEKIAGRKVWAANYSMRGARVDAVDAAVRYLKRQPNPPKLIVVGLSVRDLRIPDPDWPRVAIFWSPSDWYREFRRFPKPVLPLLPIVVRSEVGEVVWTLRYREEISLWLQRKFARFGVDGSEDMNPILGEMTMQHFGKRGNVVYNGGKVPVHKLFEHVAEYYLPTESPKAPPEMLRRLKSLVGQFKTSPPGLWLEMPMARPIRDWLTKVKQLQAFNRLMTQVLKDTTIAYRTYDEEVAAGAVKNEKFRDLQHMNRTGAQQFSRWLATQIVPMMGEIPKKNGVASGMK